VVASKKSKTHQVKGKHVAKEKKAADKPHASQPSSGSVTIDRRNETRERRGNGDRRVQSVPVAVERRVVPEQRRVKVSRRRQIDPTTCERDYTPDEIEFMGAMDEYKRRSGRMFPTCSEVLEVLKSLGYEKCAKVESTPLPGIDMPICVDLTPTVTI
jgi:hypothetical protein